MQHFVFKFILGLGNRLCNLMNMFYIHEKYPNAYIYIHWLKNKHCNIVIEDIVDLSAYTWILSAEKYYSQIYPICKEKELWATTSINDRTRWDNIEEWQKHQCIVSVSFHFFKFVNYLYCIVKFNTLKFKESIISIVQNKVLNCKSQQQFIHFRNGDLIKQLSDYESSDNVKKLLDKIQHLKLDKNNEFYEYNIDIINRSTNDVLEAVADIIFISKHVELKGYCPYSHFSSWIFLLSNKFMDDPDKYPIFNYRIIDLILL